MVVVVAIWVAATKAITRTIATARGKCSAVAEATVPVRATMIMTAEVPATSSGQTGGSARVRKTALFPGHKSSKGKSEFR
jgi:hypothetical protein